MSVSGRISIDAIFHDTAGAAINVVSLSTSKEFGNAGDVVAVVSGTIAAGSSITLNVADQFEYRDASGQVPQFANLTHLLFQFDGDSYGLLSHDLGTLSCASGFVATCIADGNEIVISSPGASGTYTVVALGSA